MNKVTAMVIGATGLVGANLVSELLSDNYFDTVRILVRKKIIIDHPKLQQEMINFNDANDLLNKFGSGDIIFCCVGTTSKKVNADITEYEKVDYLIPYNIAATGILKGFRKLLVVSSVGANAKSNNFYLRIKGKMETSLKQFPFESIFIFRPGQLLGKRNEYRRGDEFFQSVTKFISLFLFGALNKFHSIEASKVAKAMVTASKLNDEGVHVLQYREMMALIK